MTTESEQASSGKENKKLWKDVEDFLYPPWHTGSGYRGDLHYTADVRLLQEFYQGFESLTDDDREAVPDALARVRAENDKEWERRRYEALEIVHGLPDPTYFTESSVRRDVYRSTLERLTCEGALEKRSGYVFGLVPVP